MKMRWQQVMTVIALIVFWGIAPTQAQTFTEVSVQLGMNAPGPGAAWGDYDADGDLDLYVASNGEPNALYRNNGDGTFANVAASAGVDDPGPGVAVVWGDYDNDGDLDFCVANQPTGNLLYQNKGDGTFTEVGTSAGISAPAAWGNPAWGDYDSDGDLDLYSANREGRGYLFQNNGRGAFSDITISAGIHNNDLGRNPAWGDYDNDGDLDLYMTSAGATNRLYQNKGDGTFTDVSASAGVEEAGDIWLGMSWADYDNDGDLDFFVSNAGLSENRLYRNNGDGTFAEVGSSTGMSDPEGGHAVAWADYDNDGDLDLYVVAHTNHLYQNKGDGTFADVAASLGVNYNTRSGSAATWGDYDSDGDLDLYIGNINPEANLLYRNEGMPNYWLHIKLQGTVSNRSAIGARVIAVTGTQRQIREVDGGSGLCSQPSLPVEFGFGQTAMVDSLIIRWPSGIVQTFTHLATDQRIAITEDNPLITAVEEESATLPSTFSLSQNFPNPFNPQTTIHYQVPQEAEIRLTILDLAGQQVRTLAAGTHQPGQYRAVWEGTDEAGRAVASGMYLYRLEMVGRGIVETKRMALVR